MKTTVKTDYTGSLIVEPLKLQQMIMLTIHSNTGECVFVEMTPDQAGAALFGMEQALEKIGCEVTA